MSEGGIAATGGIKAPRYCAEGDTEWVRDHWPTPSQKWTQGVALSTVGAVNYIVDP